MNKLGVSEKEYSQTFHIRMQGGALSEICPTKSGAMTGSGLSSNSLLNPNNSWPTNQ